MKYNPQIHHRRSIRLKGHDYTQAGEYFVTICVKDRECILGNISLDQVKLSRIGEIAKECWERIPQHFSNAGLDEYVIMPNHVHGVIVLTDLVGTRHAVSSQEARSRQENTSVQCAEHFSKPVCGSLPTIIRSFKSAASKRIHEAGFPSFAWQSRFYEHVIRGDRDLDRIRAYILENPSNWFNDDNFANNIHLDPIHNGPEDTWFVD